MKDEVKMSGFHKFVFWCIVFADLCAVACFFIFYGPFDFFRDWAIPASVSTMKHSYLAYTFFDEEQINETTSKFKRDQKAGQSSDASLINFEKIDTSHGYSSVYEQQILEHEEGQDYKVIKLRDSKFTYWVTVIYDSTRIHMGMATRPAGNQIRNMGEMYGAKIAVNGGSFGRNWTTKAIYPDSTLILDGQIMYDSGVEDSLIGFDKNGVLCLYHLTAQDAIDRGVDWALTFWPYLIVDGERVNFEGESATRSNRTAIGQRADGIVIIITTDGRTLESVGATHQDLQNLFVRYNCVNAATLDGGGSTTLWVDGEVLNHTMGGGSTEGERFVYNCVYFK